MAETATREGDLAVAPVDARPDGAPAEGAERPYLAFDVFVDWGVRALATTRAAGSFSTVGDEPIQAVMARWAALQAHCHPGGGGRFATARQVHGAEVIVHGPGWQGWLRGHEADGHLAMARGTALAVSVADCVPVYVAHPSGAIAMLHSGWRSTAANILAVAVRRLADAGHVPGDLRVLLGPSICGRCYEVSPDVYARLTGRPVDRPTAVSLHSVIAGQARALGVRDVHATDLCTRCDNDRLFSHRAGDAGRMLGVLVAD
ncbi:MAG TPA: polyphenol oxidase family protein [Gemmatirosa sp.]|nr:polyphenol oxidase family protein [Gemmatirosa sp.]